MKTLDESIKRKEELIKTKEELEDQLSILLDEEDNLVIAIKSLHSKIDELENQIELHNKYKFP